MTAQRLSDLDRRQLRRATTYSVLRIGVTFVVLLVVYYLVPSKNVTAAQTIERLIVGLILFVAVVTYQVRHIVTASLPQLRAVEAFGTMVPLLLVIFAGIYGSLSAATPSSFTEPLSHTSALYFSVTTFATVGFGDIAARTDVARVIVSVQILFDLVLLGGIVRLIAIAARRGLTPDAAGHE